jgi:magnesium-protoporphyrin O-methyltransferase
LESVSEGLISESPEEYHPFVTSCCRTTGCEEIFKPTTARRNLRRYLKKGLGAIERSMVSGVGSEDLDGVRVLEIGGGIGAVQAELLAKGASTGEIVELVRAYEPYARELATAKGFQNRSVFRVADVLADPNAVAPAGVVVLNRVVCCSPDGIRLAGIAARLAERMLMLSFPRDRGLTRLFVKTVNSTMQLLGRSFRTYLHPRASLVGAAQDAGLVLAQTGKNLVWEFTIFRRSTTS